MPNILKTPFFILFAVFLLLSSVSFAKTTVIYHTSDTHGFFYPVDGVGGFAALAAVLQKEQRPYLLLDGGDFSNGGVEATKSKGLKSVAVLNKLKYAAGTIGNHEFYFGDEAFETMLGRITFPMIAANLADTKAGFSPPGIKPFHIFNVDGTRIAVIGLATTKIQSSKYTFIPSELALTRALLDLQQHSSLRLRGNNWLDRALISAAQRQERVNVVVLLAHSSIKGGDSAEEAFLRSVPKRFPGKFHIVLGGHAHNVIQNQKIEETLFVESGYGLKGVSRIEITTDDKTGVFTGAKSAYILLDEKQVGADEEIKNLLESLRNKETDETLAVAVSKLGFRPDAVNHFDRALHNWVADACKAHTGAEIFIFNNGAIRKEMEKGPVAGRDILEIYPHKNQLVETKVSGAFLKEFVKRGLSPHSTYSYAGLTVRFKQNQNEITAMEIRVNGKELDEKKMYHIVVNDYIVSAAEGTLFTTLSEESKKIIGQETIPQIIESALRKAGNVAPPATGRITRMDEDK